LVANTFPEVVHPPVGFFLLLDLKPPRFLTPLFRHCAQLLLQDGFQPCNASLGLGTVAAAARSAIAACCLSWPPFMASMLAVPDIPAL
jgi:hypothetical protein